jgi:hypothetical protein
LDWEKLNEKLTSIRKLLEPLEDKLHSESITSAWWDHVSFVFQNLALTLKAPES